MKRDYVSILTKYKQRESKVDRDGERSCPRVSIVRILIVQGRPRGEGRRIATSAQIELVSKKRLEWHKLTAPDSHEKFTEW